LLALTLFAVLWSQHSSRSRQWGSGALFWFTLILKPTQVLFFPLFLRTEKKKWFATGTGLGLGASITCVTYLFFRSFPQMVTDLKEWSYFIEQSQAKHLLRTDNFGLPTQLARHGFSIAQSPLFTLIGLALSTATTFTIQSLSTRIHTVVLITLIFNPMSWRQNYVILLPLAYDLISKLEAFPRIFSAWVGVVALVVLARFNGHWLGPNVERWWGLCSGPSLAAITAYFAYLSRCSISHAGHNKPDG
jgi:hypothetical protein